MTASILNFFILFKALKLGTVPITCWKASLGIGHHLEGIHHGYPSFPTSPYPVPTTLCLTKTYCSARLQQPSLPPPINDLLPDCPVCPYCYTQPDDLSFPWDCLIITGSCGERYVLYSAQMLSRMMGWVGSLLRP